MAAEIVAPQCVGTARETRHTGPMRSNRLAAALLIIWWALVSGGCAAPRQMSEGPGDPVATGGSDNAVDESETPARFSATAWRGFGGAGATATLEYSIPGAGHVRVVIYDVGGRELGRLVDSWRPAGKYTVDFAYGAGRRQVQSYRVEWAGQSLNGRITVGQ
jgi:hypothetical protein